VNTVDSEAKIQSGYLESIEPVLDNLSNYTSLKHYVHSVTEEGTTTTNNADNGRRYLANNDVYRLLVLGFGWGLMCLCVALGLVASFLRTSKISMLAGLLSFLAILLMWIIIALHFPISVLVADVCYDAEVYTIEQRLQDRINTQGNNYEAIDSILHCPRWNITMETIGWADQLYNDTEKQLSTANATEAAILTQQLQQLNQTIQTLFYVRDCNWTLTVFDQVKDSMCGKQLTGLVILWATAFVISLLMIGWTVLGIVGAKRLPVLVDEGFF